MMIPASGKSTLFEKVVPELDSLGYAVSTVSSDAIRLKIMQELMRRKKSLSKAEAFDQSSKKASTEFYAEMGRALKGFGRLPNRRCVLLLDKNCPENCLPKTVAAAKESQPPNSDLRLLGLLPRCQNLIAQPGGNFPFSLSYVLTSLVRVHRRPEHETLDGTLEHRVNVTLNFANLFRGVSRKPAPLRKFFDGAIEVGLHDDNAAETDPDTVSMLEHILLASKPNNFDAHPELHQLVDRLSRVRIDDPRLEKVTA